MLTCLPFPATGPSCEPSGAAKVSACKHGNLEATVGFGYLLQRTSCPSNKAEKGITANLPSARCCESIPRISVMV